MRFWSLEGLADLLTRPLLGAYPRLKGSLPELRFELAASFQIEALNGINGLADIVFGNVRSQELRGRGIRYYCRHGALQRADVSYRIAEIRPDGLDEVLRTTAGVAHNARQAASHCLVDN